MSVEDKVNDKLEDLAGKAKEKTGEATDNQDLQAEAEATNSDFKDPERTSDEQHLLRRARTTHPSRLTRAAQRSVLTFLPAGGQRKARRNARANRR